MIVPMKKLCLVVQKKNCKEALEKLREAGAVHIEKSGAVSDGLIKSNTVLYVTSFKLTEPCAVLIIVTFETPT